MTDGIAPLLIWVWQGEKNGVIVKASRCANILAARLAAGGLPKYTELPGAGHDSWSATWASEEMWEWLFRQRRPAVA